MGALWDVPGGGTNFEVSSTHWSSPRALAELGVSPESHPWVACPAGSLMPLQVSPGNLLFIKWPITESCLRVGCCNPRRKKRKEGLATSLLCAVRAEDRGWVCGQPRAKPLTLGTWPLRIATGLPRAECWSALVSLHSGEGQSDQTTPGHKRAQESLGSVRTKTTKQTATLTLEEMD